VPSNALDLALWMESDRMNNLAGGITQQELDEQRGVVENEKRQGELHPGAKGAERFLAAYYPAGHPYAHDTIGSIEDLNKASLADVKAWFADYYGASNAVIVLAGDIDADTARKDRTLFRRRPPRQAHRPHRAMDARLRHGPARGDV
jgi:zinc protease